MTDIKRQANPFIQLTESIDRLRIENNDRLDGIIKLKNTQQESDNNFRDAWWKAKVRDTRLSFILLGLAITALYLDVITVNSEITDFITNLIAGI